MTWQDAECFTILGDGASCDFNALFIKQFGELIVAEWFIFGLRFDQIRNGVFDAGIAEIFARISFHSMTEEEFELKDAMRRGHVLTGNGATNRRLMNTHFIGDLSHV